MNGALGSSNGARNHIGDRRASPGRSPSLFRPDSRRREKGILRAPSLGSFPLGLFRIRVVVYSLEDERRNQEMELVVDTGATYPVVPASVAEHLGIRPSEELTFTLANGTRLPRKVGWAGLAYDGRKTHTRIVFGEAEDVPLLGAFALEGLGVEVDPVARTLRPATQYLL